MIMHEQSRRLSQPLRWGRREKTVVGVLVACVVLAVAGLAAFALSSGSPARKDCISVTFASTLGGGLRHACGAEARSICASPVAYRTYGPQLADACRGAGFPIVRK
ncbi:MAG TPA: hypothetical protein VMB91_04300 [Solirubrobacteraceae bacterium]|nr:hypothetical protein [Solirubrobacteraceae bacterium]